MTLYCVRCREVAKICSSGLMHSQPSDEMSEAKDITTYILSQFRGIAHAKWGLYDIMNLVA